MNNYAENKKKIETIKNKTNEIVFRMAISHLMDVGIRHLTEENVESTCKQIMQEDDSKAFMTNEFKCNIVRIAYELAQIPQTDLVVYIQREVVYDIFDSVPSYERVVRLLKECMSQIEADENYNNIETLNVFMSLGFTDDEIESFGFQYLLEESEEE